jgi:flagellar basal-body rod modification protein FlgD
MESLFNKIVSPVQSTAATKVALALSPQRATTRDTAATSTAGNSAPAATSGSDITASDFLTLLVSEMKNQDPTQPTDPNSYLQQLVGVNSLQQLIQINQGLTSIETGSPTSTGATGS